jgi:hypothetical protein
LLFCAISRIKVHSKYEKASQLFGKDQKQGF